MVVIQSLDGVSSAKGAIMVWSAFVRRFVVLLILAGFAIGIQGPAVAAKKAERCQLQGATITGTNGDDVIRGTPGKDVIVAKSGNDVVHAGGGQDVVCGGRGADRVGGGHGRDALTGGRGDDTLRGGRKDDSLLGDVFWVPPPIQPPAVRAAGSDHLIGGRGIDTLTGDNFSTTARLRGAGDDVLEDRSGFRTDMTGDNRASGVRVSGKGDDVLINRTGPGSSHLVGDHNNDTGSVTGRGGNDRIRSGAGNDTLVGDSVWIHGSPGGGRDRLSAGAGDDGLTGGPKRDRCRGDGGTDFASQCEVVRGIP